MRSRSEKISLILAIVLHLAIAGMLFISFGRTIVIPEDPASGAQAEKIIEAVMVKEEVLQKEMSRLENIETKKRERLENEIKEAKEKRQQQEQLALELKNKNEALEKAAEQKRVELAKQAELAKIQKEKEKEKEAAIIAKKKAEQAEKAKALAEQQEKENENAHAQATVKANQDEVVRHAKLMRSKIQQHWRQPIGFDVTGLKCRVSMRLLPTGEVVTVKIIASSGNVEFDRSTELAIQKASPLPMPEDPTLAKVFREVDFMFTPGAV